MTDPREGPNPARVTRLLQAVDRGEAGSTDALLVAVYDELRALARARMRHEPSGHTLQPTALVHEAYLRLLGSRGADEAEASRWDHRGHFFAAAATAMRRILVERARRRRRAKHGGDLERVELDETPAIDLGTDVDLLALDEALSTLREKDPRMAAIVDLRFFAGLDGTETALALGVSERTVKRDWAVARAWLYEALADSGD